MLKDINVIIRMKVLGLIKNVEIYNPNTYAYMLFSGLFNTAYYNALDFFSR